MAAILKILKTKSTTLSDNLILCQVSKGSAVRSEFNIFCTLANGHHFEFVQPPKAATHYGGYFHEFGERNPKISKMPPFLFPWQLVAKFVQPIPIFLAYLVPLDVDVVPIKFHQFLFGE